MLLDPIKTLDTGVRDLTCQVAGQERHYLGFSMGNDETLNLEV